MQRHHPREGVHDPHASIPVHPSVDPAHIRECFRRLIQGISPGDLELRGVLLLCDASGIVLERHALHEAAEGLFAGFNGDWLQLGAHAIANAIKDKQSSQVRRDEHTHPSLKAYCTLAKPLLDDSNELTAVLGLLYEPRDEREDREARALFAAWEKALQSDLLRVRKQAEVEHLATMKHSHEEEMRKKAVLYQVAKQLHGNTDVDSVLGEIMNSMKKIYPSAEIELYLTQDHCSQLPMVKPLQIPHGEEDSLMRAYMESRAVFTCEIIAGRRCQRLAVPLSGKQGVYGILQVIIEEESGAELDVPFITELAESAGAAFENARLHESSNIMIHELRLINEITRRLNQSLKPQEVFQFATDELIKIFKANFGLIIQTDKDNRVMTVQSSNITEMTHASFDLDYGFAGRMIESREPVIVSDYAQHPEIPSKFMEMTGARSMIGSPIIVGTEVLGVIMMAHRLPEYFTYDNFKLLQVLSGHIGLAMTNASLHAEVRRMAVTDHLTGLYNRHYLDEQIKLMQQRDPCGSLLLTDIDLFKNINDTHGHQIGDESIRQVAQIIKGSIRDTDIAARWGGEEMAVYLPKLQLDQALMVAERIRRRVEEETDPKVTISCGVSHWNREDEKISVESLFYRADMALYEAKRTGRNQVRIG